MNKPKTLTERERRLILKLLNKERRIAKDVKYMTTIYDLQYKFRGNNNEETINVNSDVQ